MKSSPSSPSPKRLRARHWVLLCLVGLFFFVLVGLVRLFLLDGDAGALRDGLNEPAGSALKTKVQLSLGPVSTRIARFCAGRFVALSKDQREFLSSVRGLSVGVYEIASGHGDEPGILTRSRLGELDARMDKRGWVRLVAVGERDDAVLVYTTKDEIEGSEARFCVALADRGQLIVASVRADLEPIVRFVRERHGAVLGDTLLAGGGS